MYAYGSLPQPPLYVSASSTPLHDAADTGDTAAVIRLLRDGADANARIERLNYHSGATPLHLAAQRGHLEVVLALLDAGAESNGRAVGNRQNDEIGYRGEWLGDLTPLHLACSYGHAAVVRALLCAGDRSDWIACGKKVGVEIPLDHSGRAFFGEHEGGHRPLHLASAYGHADVVRELVGAGARVQPQGGDCGDTPLHLASASGRVGAMAALLEAGADMDARDEIGNTPLHVVKDVETMEFLLAAGANPNLVAESPYGSGTPLGSYCTLIHRYDTNEKDMEDATAQVEVLLRHGADTSIHASCDYPLATSPILSCAAKNGVPGIVSALLGAGLDPNEQDMMGWAPLHDAARGDHVEVVRLLLRAGADRDAPTRRGGWTPLHLACRYTSLECLLELLRWGADMDAKTGIDSDDDAWHHDRLFGKMANGVSRGFGKTPAEVIGLRHHAAAPAELVGGSRDPSQDEDEQMDVFDEETGERDTSAVQRNAIRRALRREAAWRRRRGVVLLKVYLDRQLEETGPSAAPGRAAGLASLTPIRAKTGDAGGVSKNETDSGDFDYNGGGVRRSGRGAAVDEGRCGLGIQRRVRRTCSAPQPVEPASPAGGGGGIAGVQGGVGDGVDTLLLWNVLNGVVDLAGCEKALFIQVIKYL